MKNPSKIKDMIPGCVHETANFGKVEIVKYNGSSNVTIRFIDTGHISVSKSSAIRAGKVKDPTSRIIYGVGFVGVGRHSSKSNPVCYKTWNHMMERCYSDKYHEYQPTYKDCHVCDEWHNFQSFADWFEDNYPKCGGDYQIDKDFKVMRNKTYSPDNCLFLSRKVNSFINDRSNSRGSLMIGASLSSNGSFKSTCKNPTTGKVDYLGCFNSEVGAHEAWRTHKAKMCRLMIEDASRKEDKEALLNYLSNLESREIYNNGYNK